MSFLPGGRKLVIFSYERGHQVLDLDDWTSFVSPDPGSKPDRYVFSADGTQVATSSEREDVVRIRR